MNDDSPVSGVVAAWQKTFVESASLALAGLAEAVRRNDVMVSITITPYVSEVDDE